MVLLCIIPSVQKQCELNGFCGILQIWSASINLWRVFESLHELDGSIVNGFAQNLDNQVIVDMFQCFSK